jgi:hypothetical protein
MPVGVPAPVVTTPDPTVTVTTSTPMAPAAPTGTPAAPQQNGQTPPKTEDKGFPDNTKVEDMTVEQQAAYWKYHSRKHESRVSALGNLTPEDVQALRDKAAQFDAAEAEKGTDMEKAVRSAYEQAEKAVLAKIQPQLVTAEFRAAAVGRIDNDRLASILEPLDLAKFLAADGSVDTAKVSSYVNGIAPAMGSSTAQPPFPSLGQGQHTAPPTVPGAAGAAAAAKRFGKPASPTT